MSTVESQYLAGLGAPAKTIVAVTKSDTVDLTGGECRALLVGTAGTAKVTTAGGDTVTDIPLQAGYNPIRVTRVWNSGTASDIWALY